MVSDVTKFIAAGYDVIMISPPAGASGDFL